MLLLACLCATTPVGLRFTCFQGRFERAPGSPIAWKPPRGLKPPTVYLTNPRPRMKSRHLYGHRPSLGLLPIDGRLVDQTVISEMGPD